MSDNGVLKVETVNGRPSIILYETGAGEIAHITPINLPTLRAIQVKAEKTYPYPNKTAYQKPEENAFAEGQLSPAEDNPEYVALVQEVNKQRAQWVDKMIFGYAVKFPKYPTPESMVEAYRDQLDALREIAELPKDDYEAVLFNIVLSWNRPAVDKSGFIEQIAQTDYGRIIHLAIQAVALSPSEVAAGIRFFRPQI